MQVHLEAFLETGNQEDLHRFRVQIKKLKAMFSLLEDASSQQGLLKNFKPVRKIFKYAGHIRDAHTNLLLSERYKLTNEAFETGQQKIIADGTNEFQSNRKKFIKSIEGSYKSLKKQLPKVSDEAIAEFYKNQLEHIAGKLAVPDFSEEMHSNRKLIKTLVYNHKLTDKALEGSLHINSEYLDKLQSTIGEWHDNIVAEQLFASPELNDLPVLKKIKKTNAGVQRNIKSLAVDFLKKATEHEENKVEKVTVENEVAEV